MAEIFHIVPATNRAMMFFVPVAVLVLIVAVGTTFVLGASIRGSRHSTFEISDAGLRLRGDLYGRMIPAAQLRGTDTRVVDLRTERGFQPTFKTLGTGLPGYRAGWFRLANGGKALLYLTDSERAVHVPTRAGYSVLLSVDRPDDFVARVRAIARSD